MKSFFNVFIFMLAFQMEVRVRASDSVSAPENCLGREVPCAYKVSTEKWSFGSGNIKIHAVKGSVLTEIEKAREWKLVGGSLWVENAPSVKVRSTTSEVEGSSGQYWMMIEKDRTIYRNISAKLIVTLKDQNKIEVPKGFEVWVGGVNSESQVEHGMVEPIDIKAHLKLWYSLYPGKQPQFLSEVQDLKDQWADRIEQSGEIYKKVIERKLAAVEDEKRQIEEKKRKQESERLRIREEFRKKVFEN